MADKEFNENELLFNELYEKTKECGRVQFIKLLMEKERENQKLKKELSNSHQIKNQQKEFIEYLETEKDRLARECSPIYEDGLGKTRLVSEDIFNEINDVLSKYKEIIGVNGN